MKALKKKQFRILLPALALALLATACGGGDDKDSTGGDNGSTGDNGSSGEDDAVGDHLVAAMYGGDTRDYNVEFWFKPFEEETGISTELISAPGEFLSGISAQNQAGNIVWDYSAQQIGSDVATMHKEGFLSEMPAELLEKMKDKVPGTLPYAIPSQASATRILCNQKIADKCPTNAAELFDLENFPGPRSFSSFQPFTLIVLALEAEGIAKDEMLPADEGILNDQLDIAFAALEDFRPGIKAFYSSSNEAFQQYNQGEIAMGGLWENAVKTLVEENSDNVDLAYTWQDAVIEPQYEIVYKGGPNEAGAWKFFEWLYDNPEQIAKYASAAPAATRMGEAFEMMDPAATEWLAPPPGTPEGDKTFTVDALGIFGYDAIVDRIDEFWQNYTTS